MAAWVIWSIANLRQSLGTVFINSIILQGQALYGSNTYSCEEFSGLGELKPAPFVIHPPALWISENMNVSSSISVCLWFNGKAEEAARLYTSLIPNSEVTSVSPVMVTFTLDGVPFQALKGGPQFKPTEAASIVISTRNQEDTDRLWSALTADGGTEGRCAWLKDRFGVSWQVVPQVLPKLLGASDRQAANRALEAMLKMSKIDIKALEAAFNQPPA